MNAVEGACKRSLWVKFSFNQSWAHDLGLRHMTWEWDFKSLLSSWGDLGFKNLGFYPRIASSRWLDLTWPCASLETWVSFAHLWFLPEMRSGDVILSDSPPALQALAKLDMNSNNELINRILTTILSLLLLFLTAIKRAINSTEKVAALILALIILTNSPVCV